MTQRTIKFRAWDKENKHMEEVAEIKFIGRNSEPYKVFVGYGEQLNDFALMQFTGLHDKNGKEIYEGDILCDVVEVEKEKPKFLYRVEWAEDIGPGWVAIPPNGRCFLAEMNLSLYKVIGHIHENPDLLK